jgi:hypothetical protein
MKTISLYACAGLFGCLLALPAVAQTTTPAPGCRDVSGSALWSLIPAPNDKFGRIMGPSIGDLPASITAIITNLVPSSTGVLSTESEEVWLLSTTDIITFKGKATFTPRFFTTPVIYDDALTLTATGGFGRYSKVTGTIEVRGAGYNINAGPGAGYFDVRYKGTLCGIQP